MNHPDHYFNDATTRVAAQASVTAGSTAGERDTGNWYIRTASGWLQIVQSGIPLARVSANDAGFAESIQTDYLYSGTPAAVGTTPDISGYGLPFDKLKFVKSAAANSVAIRVGISGAGRVMIDISGLGVETIAIFAQIDGVTDTAAICVRRTDGTFAAASALTNGTYYLVMG